MPQINRRPFFRPLEAPARSLDQLRARSPVPWLALEALHAEETNCPGSSLLLRSNRRLARESPSRFPLLWRVVEMVLFPRHATSANNLSAMFPCPRGSSQVRFGAFRPYFLRAPPGRSLVRRFLTHRDLRESARACDRERENHGAFPYYSLGPAAQFSGNRSPPRLIWQASLRNRLCALFELPIGSAYEY